MKTTVSRKKIKVNFQTILVNKNHFQIMA